MSEGGAGEARWPLGRVARKVCGVEGPQRTPSPQAKACDYIGGEAVWPQRRRGRVGNQDKWGLGGGGQEWLGRNARGMETRKWMKS